MTISPFIMAPSKGCTQVLDCCDESTVLKYSRQLSQKEFIKIYGFLEKKPYLTRDRVVGLSYGFAHLLFE
jgi:hypothetical protein